MTRRQNKSWQAVHPDLLKVTVNLVVMREGMKLIWVVLACLMSMGKVSTDWHRQRPAPHVWMVVSCPDPFQKNCMRFSERGLGTRLWMGGDT